MIKIPIENPRPDFDTLNQVLLGKKKPQKVHFVEMLIDEEIKNEIITKYFGEKNHPPTVTFGGSSDEEKKDIDLEEARLASEKYYKQLIDFYYRLGYSVLTDYEFLVNFQSFNTVGRIGKDPGTSKNARAERHWAQEGTGLIKDWQDFEDFPWKKIEDMLNSYGDHLEFLGNNLPDGMKIAVVGSVLEQVMEWLMGYEGVAYGSYDKPDLVGAVFEKVGKLVNDLYLIAAPMDCVGVIWHGDDIGFKTATMLSPELLRKWVFPWFKKYADIAHRYDKPVWMHACGYKSEVMQDFIEDIGFDAIHSFEDGCCPVIEYKKEYGDRIGLIGGLDCDKMTRLEGDDFRKYVNKILDACMPGGRFALGSGNSVTNFMPVENFLIMLDEGKNYLNKK